MGGDDSGPEEDDGEDDGEDEYEANSDDEDETNGMIIPAGLEAQHHEEHGDAGVDSDQSSGLESFEASDDSLDQGDENEHDDGASEEPAALSQAHGPSTEASKKLKLFDQSAEWMQLVQLGNESGCNLVRIPLVIGCGVSRHPAKTFWSARYPGKPSKAVSWSDKRSPIQCLAKCLRFVIKEYLNDHPKGADLHSWEQQRQALADLEK